MDETLRMWGDNIRRHRQALGLNQYELADLVGVRQPTIWRWEKGQMEPRRRHKMLLSKILDVDVRALFPLSSGDQPSTLSIAAIVSAPPSGP